MTYNKAEIMRRGNELRKTGCTHSDALRMAWAEAKAANSTKPVAQVVRTVAASVSRASVVTATVIASEANGEVELAEQIRKYKEIQMLIKQLEEESDTIKAAVTAEMEAQQTDKLTVDVFTVRWTPYTSKRFDTTRFKAEHADLYGAYAKTTETKRFSIA